MCDLQQRVVDRAWALTGVNRTQAPVPLFRRHTFFAVNHSFWPPDSILSDSDLFFYLWQGGLAGMAHGGDKGLDNVALALQSTAVIVRIR